MRKGERRKVIGERGKVRGERGKEKGERVEIKGSGDDGVSVAECHKFFTFAG